MDEETRAYLEEIRADLRSLRGGTEEFGGTLRGEIVVLREELRGEMVALRQELGGEMGTLRGELRGELAGLRDELRLEMAGLRDELRRHFDVVAEHLERDIATVAEVVLAQGEALARIRIDLTREIDSRVKASEAVMRAGFRLLQRDIESLRARE